MTPPKTATADEILGVKPKTETVKIDALGGKYVTVRGMLVSDQLYIEEKLGDSESLFEAMIWNTIRCCVEPAFLEDQFAQLKDLPAGALEEIDNAIGSLRGGAATAKAATKSVSPETDPS